MRVIFAAAAAAAASTDPAANWNNYFHETFNNKSSLRTAAAEKQARNLSTSPFLVCNNSTFGANLTYIGSYE